MLDDDYRPPYVDFRLTTCRGPYSEDVERDCRRWAEEAGLLHTSRLREHLRGAALGELVARTHPFVPLERSLVLGHLYAWTVHIDCVFDGQDGEISDDPEPLRNTLAEVASVLASDTPLECPVSIPAARGLASLWHDTIPGMSVRWRARTARNVLAWLESYAVESEHRTSGVTPSLEEYVELRRDTVAMYATTAYFEFCEELEVPDELYELYREILEVCIDATAWTNDLYSARRELEAGDLDNAVVVISHERGCTLQQAAEDLARSILARAEDFGILRRRLDRSMEHLGIDPGLRDGIRRCVRSAELWVSGHRDWGMLASRYGIRNTELDPFPRGAPNPRLTALPSCSTRQGSSDDLTATRPPAQSTDARGSERPPRLPEGVPGKEGLATSDADALDGPVHVVRERPA